MESLSFSLQNNYSIFLTYRKLEKGKRILYCRLKNFTTFNKHLLQHMFQVENNANIVIIFETNLLQKVW